MWWSCFSPLTPVLAAAPLAELLVGSVQEETGRKPEMGVAGLVPWLTQGQQGSVGSTCSGALAVTVPL